MIPSLEARAGALVGTSACAKIQVQPTANRESRRPPSSRMLPWTYPHSVRHIAASKHVQLTNRLAAVE